MGYERLNLKTGQVITEDVFAHLEDGIESAANAALMTPILYANLVALRDAGQLKAGTFYRITDYVTTTIQANTQSAGHAFDVIVLALSESKLSEQAYAAIHKGDTYFTEAGANLAAWKVWYCLDNDSEWFEWADAENGKGVIYRLIDEHNNDCPYDFKNILFIKPTSAKGQLYMYGSWFDCEMARDKSKDQTIEGIPYYAWTVTKVSGPSGSGVAYSVDEALSDLALYDISDGSATESEILKASEVIEGFTKYTFTKNSGDIIDASVASLNTHHNKIGQILYPAYYGSGKPVSTLNWILFGGYCNNNTFGNNCDNNTLGEECRYISIGDNCSYNNFGNDCSYNNFGNDCSYNNFGSGCYSNSIGNNCSYNNFGNDCSYNNFGGGCSSNNFGRGCYSNSVGNSCSNVELNEDTLNQTASANSNGEVKVFNLADLAE